MKIKDHAYLDYNPKTGVTPSIDTSELTFDPAVTTTYKLTGFSIGDCPTYDTVTFTVVRAPSPIAEFSVNPHDAPISNPVFILKNLSFYASTYEWYYNNLLFAFIQIKRCIFFCARGNKLMFIIINLLIVT
jgi:hypothetical protein